MQEAEAINPWTVVAIAGFFAIVAVFYIEPDERGIPTPAGHTSAGPEIASIKTDLSSFGATAVVTNITTSDMLDVAVSCNFLDGSGLVVDQVDAWSLDTVLPAGAATNIHVSRTNAAPANAVVCQPSML